MGSNASIKKKRAKTYPIATVDTEIDHIFINQNMRRNSLSHLRNSINEIISKCYHENLKTVDDTQFTFHQEDNQTFKSSIVLCPGCSKQFRGIQYIYEGSTSEWMKINPKNCLHEIFIIDEKTTKTQQATSNVYHDLIASANCAKCDKILTVSCKSLIRGGNRLSQWKKIDY